MNKTLIVLAAAIVAGGIMLRLSWGEDLPDLRTAEKIHHDREDPKIAAHAKLLKEMGRMADDFPDAHLVLGTYGWHPAKDGARFGAYSFNPAAFEQAKRGWWINGVMETGSDLLHAVNRRAKFTDDAVGHRVAYIAAWREHDGVRSFEPVLDATVMAIPKYDDGSPMSSLVRLDKKAPGFAMTFGIAILPPDYADVSNSTVGSATMDSLVGVSLGASLGAPCVSPCASVRPTITRRTR